MQVVSITGRLDSAEFHEAKACATLLADEHKRDLEADITPMLEREWSEFVLQQQTVRGDAWGLGEKVFITVDGELQKNLADFGAWVTESFGIAEERWAQGEDKINIKFGDTANQAYKAHIANPKRDFVYMDIKIGDDDAGKLVFELYSDICPKTCDNFKQLCTGDAKNKSDSCIKYRDSLFHRIQDNGWVQGGDIVDGTGKNGDSIYGETFADENYIVQHSGRGVLAMANKGLHTNASQFLLSFRALEWMNEKNVAFGQLVEGSATFKAIETTETASSGRPVKNVVIADCGEFVA